MSAKKVPVCLFDNIYMSKLLPRADSSRWRLSVGGTVKKTTRRRLKMSIQINELPADSVEFMDGYYITPEAEMYKMIKENEYKRLHQSNINGYPTVFIKSKNILIHKIFAETYIPNPLGYDKVFFKNGNKNDISKENLEWGFYELKGKVLSEFPREAKRYKDKYLVTEDAEIYEECENGKFYKLSKARTGRSGHYAVLINGKYEYMHRIYASIYMDNYNPAKYVYFKDNNDENITLGNLTQNTKDRDFDFFDYTYRLCPVCHKNRMQKKQAMCSECKKKEIKRVNKDKRKQKYKTLASKLIELSTYKKLTDKQNKVLNYMMQGYTQSEIARMMGVSRQDVHICIKSMEKFF